MEFETFRKNLGKAIKFLFGTLIFLFLVGFLALQGSQKPEAERNKYVREQIAKSRGIEINDNYPQPWPPAMNVAYPDYELIDQEGVQFKLSDYKGKIIILEMVDMSSPFSQAYSNAAEIGLFGTTEKYDEYTKPIETLLREYSEDNLVLPLPNVVTIKVIVQTQNGTQPSVKDAEEWAAFFRLTKANSVVVAVPVKDIRGKLTEKITPGYQLIDADMMLRVDSAGLEPKHNLQMTLVPQLQKLIGY